MGKKSFWFVDYDNADAPNRIHLVKLDEGYNVAPKHQTYEEGLNAAIDDIGKSLNHDLEEFKEKLIKLKSDASLEDIDSLNSTLKDIRWAFDQYEELMSNRLNDLAYGEADDE